jgi:hypothetical protein
VTGERFGGVIAQSYFSGLGTLGDLDGDSLSELLAGGQRNTGDDVSAALYYGRDNFVGTPLRSAAQFLYSTTNTQVSPNYVGDINDDGFNDFVILESGAETNKLVLHF